MLDAVCRSAYRARTLAATTWYTPLPDDALCDGSGARTNRAAIASQPISGPILTNHPNEGYSIGTSIVT
jgi:hypothetical protein